MQGFRPRVLGLEYNQRHVLNIIMNREERSKKMNLMKGIWRLVLCGLFVIGLTYGLSAHATEPEEHEKALQETYEATEAVEPEETEAEEETQEMEAEEEAPGEEETDETKEEGQH
jgi:hypothetical protein